MLQEARRIPQQLRDYQERAVVAVTESWRNPATLAPMIVAATGAGKTTIIADLLRRAVDPHTQRALVVGHTEEIVFQLYERIADQFAGELDGMFGFGGLFGSNPGLGIVMANMNAADARIVVATRQSLHARRLPALLAHGRFDYLVVDECHHVSAGNSYYAIVDALRAANPALKIVGVTATPARNDRKALGAVFTNIPFQWTIQDGVDSGHLVPPRRIQVATQVDASTIKTAQGDYAQDALMSLLDAENWLELALQAFWEYVIPLARPTLAFFPAVAMSREFATALQAANVPVAHLDGSTPKDERRAMLRDYRDGRIQVITNVAVLTEGVDAPATGCIFLARPTRSPVLMTQILGRGLRPYMGKTDCVLVDLTVCDTKALSISTLIGRMEKCPACASEFFKGFSHCPTCGESLIPKVDCTMCGAKYEITLDACPVCHTPREKADPIVKRRQAFQGSGLFEKHISVFEDAFAAWYEEGGICSVSLGDAGALVILPPVDDDLYRLIAIPKDERAPLTTLARSGDPASLLVTADSVIRATAQSLADKEAQWRWRHATEKQLGFLQKLGGKAPEGATMGLVSSMITHRLAVRRIDAALAAREKAPGKSA